MNFRDEIQEQISKALVELGIDKVKLELEHPVQEEHGDYSTNVAMVAFGKTQKWASPLELAEAIVSLLKADSYQLKAIEKIELAPPGFINFWLSNKALLQELAEACEIGESYGKTRAGRGQSIVLEHTSPNTNKPLHIGHIRNNTIGMALVRLYKFDGNKVYPVEIINDRGAHIMQSMWGYLRFGKLQPKDVPWEKLLAAWYKSPSDWATPDGEKGDHFIGKYYVLAEKVKDEVVSAEIQSMLQAWEKGDRKLKKLWETNNQWFYDGVDKTYKRLGSVKSERWYESQIYKKGKSIIEKNLGKFFKKDEDGGVVARLEKYGIPDKVVLRSDGTSLYITQDIALLFERKRKYKADCYVYITASEQNLQFKQLFAIASGLGWGDIDKFYHIGYGLVRLVQGKMSSRLGTVVYADSFLDEMKELAKKKIESAQIRKTQGVEEVLAEQIGIGAVKYSMLRYSPTQDIIFDPQKTVSFEGDSGPYLQYTYARTQSVLAKAKTRPLIHLRNKKLKVEELAILRQFYKFPEVVQEAVGHYAPNMLCNFLFEFAQRFNTLYNKHQISHDKFRLAQTAVVGNILKSGLAILGIEAPERM